ncbi:aspartyl/asparaginyl beta-hydroxylase domain-containing protein [Porphyrobacter sp. CACIAM 03H1]|uniref:aspartyl/asparaginyl beta-hydroxylase domain-containing protein n=1 Tax=Porphyrobacter sp. CACIAM 03H1 TaxID=2003315 RepID=UPI001F159DFB|nr:aspartyl/asparaginyl beta-hydroxylase domain-containing protein [Porphyrobacter sp. CACIAM 03H1]
MTVIAPDLSDRIAAADRALAGGNLAEARHILEEAVRRDPPTPDFWQRLATVRKMAGATGLAIEAIDRALALAPLDFVNLLMRAHLLDGAGHPEAGEAYGRALAQPRPDPLPPMFQRTLARAEALWAAHQRDMTARLAGAVEASGADLTPAERARAERFASNIARTTRPYHSEPTHFAWPGLREAEFHHRAAFPWLEELEALTPVIRAEMDAVANAPAAALVPYVNYADSEPLAQWRDLNHNRDWTAIHLIERGEAVTANTAHCPVTMDFLARMDQPRIAGCAANAMFSLLAPRTHIPPHVGVANFRLLCHLPLIVPNRCWFRVGAETRDFAEGQAWVFDDTIEHEAMNETDALRVILIFDLWHPDLSPAERSAIQAAVSAAAMPVGAL